MSELKFVEGGWYQQRNGVIHKMGKIEGGFASCKCCCMSWTDYGSYDCTHKHDRDLIRRVMPPVDYVATKKWLWERDDDIYGCVILTKTVLEHPPWGNESNWRKVEGSEVEE